jgi:hypothetical protein
LKFNLETPCKDCPFICGSSTNLTLAEGRLDDIIDDLRYKDQSFICHKTTDLPSSEQQHCGGALIFLEKENNPNQMMRIAERIGLYDRRKLNMDADIIDNDDY